FDDYGGKATQRAIHQRHRCGHNWRHDQPSVIAPIALLGTGLHVQFLRDLNAVGMEHDQEPTHERRQKEHATTSQRIVVNSRSTSPVFSSPNQNRWADEYNPKGPAPTHLIHSVNILFSHRVFRRSRMIVLFISANRLTRTHAAT